MVAKCYVPFKISSLIVALVDLVGAVAVTILGIISWNSLKVSLVFVHQRRPKETSDEYNELMFACVSYWILTLLFCMMLVRFMSSLMLFVTVKRKSVLWGKLWIVVKFLAFTISLFLALAALTVGMYTRLATGVDLIFHLVTLFEVKVLVDSFTDLERQTFVEKSGRSEEKITE